VHSPEECWRHGGIARRGLGTVDGIMPALSSTMKEGKIVQWTVTEGQKVSAGDVLMVVESDKVMMMNNDTLPHTLITKRRIMDPNHQALVPCSVRFLDPKP